MRPLNLAISIFASAAKTFRCWLMAHMKSWHFQGVKSFARDQRLILETPGWRVLEFEGNSLSESELERQRERILQDPLIIRDRQYLFTEDLIVDDFGTRHATLPVLARCGRWLKSCNWAAPTSWFTNCGRNSRWLPAEWILTWHDLPMKCWSVIFLSMCLRVHVHWFFVAVFYSIISNGM